LDQLL